MDSVVLSCEWCEALTGRIKLGILEQTDPAGTPKLQDEARLNEKIYSLRRREE
jgi:hypothetical protein